MPNLPVNLYIFVLLVMYKQQAYKTTISSKNNQKYFNVFIIIIMFCVLYYNVVSPI